MAKRKLVYNYFVLFNYLGVFDANLTDLRGLRMKRLVLVLSSVFFCGISYAKTCTQTIEGNDAMQFNLKEMTVAKDCTELVVTLKHVGKLPKTAMGHNWILTEEKDFNPLMSEALKAGPANNYVPKDDKRIIAATKLVGGGESDTVTVDLKNLKKDYAYTYFCSFPGHSALMKGTLTIK